MIYLHKILPLFLSPVFVFTIVILLGLLTRRRWLCLLALAGLWLFSLPAVSNHLFRWVEHHAVRQNVATMPAVETIVVLSGMLTDAPSVDGVVPEWHDPDRFFAGLELYRAGKGKTLVFTRGQMPWSLARQTEGDVLRQAAIDSGIPGEAIRLTSEVVNTQEEAVAVKNLLRGQSQRLILVTSAFHMPRARALFEREGLEVLPFPVDFKISVEKSTLMDFLPNAGSLAMSERAMRELLGRLYYRLIFREPVSARPGA